MGYHMLLHSMNRHVATDIGVIAWSIDGLSDWTLSAVGEGAYGPVFKYVEEPKLLFDIEKSLPIYLANVCSYGNDKMFVSMVPIKH